MKKKIIQTGIRMTDDLHYDLSNCAENKGVSMNSLILYILWDWVEKRKQKGDRD